MGEQVEEDTVVRRKAVEYLANARVRRETVGVMGLGEGVGGVVRSVSKGVGRGVGRGVICGVPAGGLPSRVPPVPGNRGAREASGSREGGRLGMRAGDEAARVCDANGRVVGASSSQLLVYYADDMVLEPLANAFLKDPEGQVRKSAGQALLWLAPLRTQTVIDAATRALDDIYQPVRELAVRLLVAMVSASPCPARLVIACSE